MIVSWISHANRQLRRAQIAKAKKLGVSVDIQRVTAGAVSGHVVTLTNYLVNPTPEQLRKLATIEGAERYLPLYFARDKYESDVFEAVSDTELAAAHGERVLQVLTRNLLSEALEDRQFELGLVAGMSPGPHDPIEHVVVSWVAGEHPAPDQVEDALDVIMTVIGMERHQVFATLHGDTSNVHLHLAVNRVDPITGKRAEFGLGAVRSIEALHQAIAIIAHRQGWATQENALYRADDDGCYDRLTGKKVRDRRLLTCASDGDCAIIRRTRREADRDAKIPRAARLYERRTGLHSLQRRVLDDAAPIVRRSDTWDEIHRGLALFGMRYRILPSGGAVIECGDRSISASTAWSGASEAKMTHRLGAYVGPSPNLHVAVFEEREFDRLAPIVARERARRAIKADEMLANASNAAACKAVSVGYADDIAIANQPPQLCQLNKLRSAAAARSHPLRGAIDRVRRLNSARRKHQRAQLKADELNEDFMDEEFSGEARGLLMGTRGEEEAVRLTPLTDYEVELVGGSAEYRRNGALAFVEHRDRIDLHLVDDDVLRQAMLLAKAKWGSVVATGDSDLLHRLARIAVDENITLTNPELQPIIAQMRAQKYMELRVVQAEEERINQAAAEERTQLKALRMSELKALRDYSVDFTSWLKMRYANAPDREREAAAFAIASNPKLARELEQLSSQKFAIAQEIITAAGRERRRVDVAAAPCLKPPEGATGAVSVPTQKPPIGAAAPLDVAQDQVATVVKSDIPSADAVLFAMTALRRSQERAAAILRSLLDKKLCPYGSPSVLGKAFLLDLHDHPEYYTSHSAHGLACRDPGGNREAGFRVMMEQPRIAELAIAVFTRDAKAIPSWLAADIGAPSYQRPLTKWMNDAALEANQLEQKLPNLLSAKPLILKSGQRFGIASEALLIAAGTDAIGIFGPKTQYILNAAYLIQQIERQDCIGMIARDEVTLKFALRDGHEERVIVESKDPAKALPAIFSPFLNDLDLLIHAAKHVDVAMPPMPTIAPAIRAWQTAASDGASEAVQKQIALFVSRDPNAANLLKAVGPDLGREILKSAGDSRASMRYFPLPAQGGRAASRRRGS